VYLCLLFKYFVGLWQPKKLHLFLWGSIMNLTLFLIPTFFVIPNILEETLQCGLRIKLCFIPTFFVIPNTLGDFSWANTETSIATVFEGQVDSFSIVDWTPHFQIFSTILIDLIKLINEAINGGSELFFLIRTACSQLLRPLIVRDHKWSGLIPTLQGVPT